MKKNTSAFTVVELMVVIVIIALLAAVSLVSYRGITARANDSQTLSAAGQWIKILMNYRARNGSLPSMSSCLGAGYGYNADGKGASGVGQCRQDTASDGVLDDPSFDAMLEKYITAQPTPSLTTTATNSATNWYRGAYYYVYPDPSSSGKTFGRIDLVLSPSTSCPTQVGGITGYAPGTTSDGDRLCHYSFGDINSYN